MSKMQDALLSKRPNIFFEPSSNLTRENLQEEVLIPFLVKEIKLSRGELIDE